MGKHDSKVSKIQVDIIDNKNDAVEFIEVRKKLRGPGNASNTSPNDYIQQKDLEVLKDFATKSETRTAVETVQKRESNSILFAWGDKFERIAAYIDSAGFFKAFKYALNSIPGSALQMFNGNEKINNATITENLLAEAVKKRLSIITDLPGFKFAFVDSVNRFAGAIRDNGSFLIPKPEFPLKSINGASIKDSSLGVSKFDDSVKSGLAIVSNFPGYRFVIWDGLRFAFAIKNDGTVLIPKLGGSSGIADGSVSYIKLNDFLKTLKIRNTEECIIIGDSVIAANNIQPEFSRITGMSVTTHAKGGIGFIQMVDGDGAGFPALTSAQLVNKKVLILAGGLNERSRTLGVRSDLYPNQTSVCGRMNYVINRINALAAEVNNQTLRIFIATPHKVGKYPFIDYTGSQIYPISAGGNDKSLEDMVKVQIDLASSYGYPALNNYYYSGINEFNWEQFTLNTIGTGGPFPNNRDQLHPNLSGGIQIGRYWAGEVNKF